MSLGKAIETLTARQKLLSYLANADESRNDALYALLEGDIQKVDSFILSDEQFAILEDERQNTWVVKLNLIPVQRLWTSSGANEISDVYCHFLQPRATKMAQMLVIGMKNNEKV